MCCLSRTSEALGAAASTTAGCAIASFLFLDNLNFVMGLLQAAKALGLMIGPIFGGLLYSVDGFYLPFAVTASIYFLLTIVAFFLLPSIDSKHHSNTRLYSVNILSIILLIDNQQLTNSNISIIPLLKSPTIIVIGCLLAVAQMLLGFIDVSLAPYLQQFHLSPVQVGGIFLIAPATLALSSPIYGKICDKLGKERSVLIVGISISLIGFLLIGPSKLFFFIRCKLWLVGVSFAIAGIGWGSIITTYKEFVDVAKSKDYPEGIETDGIISGLYNAYNNFGAFLGPTISGYIVDQLGFQWSSTLFGGIFALSLISLIGLTAVERCFQSNRNLGRIPMVIEE
ncbi:DgyrCDS12952 [Dimorphilus gyrociliatus]|uniref:DgyrCDS12952 n=1 Tax=Dimorphilus gyrociliatus TaxID=2664684 RepID=A0A7I8W985_9ANNE|nr:DgyrCDS12952 [Dimorphilus gyrociliatus]